MRKKTGYTIVEQAVMLVPEFENVVRKLEQQVTLCGQSKSTLQNYIRRIALFVIRFEKLPQQIAPEEINEYLAALARDPRSPSRSSFKHMVYGLRYYYRLMGMNKNAIALPSLKKEAKPCGVSACTSCPEGLLKSAGSVFITTPPNKTLIYCSCRKKSPVSMRL